MENKETQENEFEVPFGKFSEKVVEEFKLAHPQQYRITARMIDGFMMMQDWKNHIPAEKEVRVFFALNYRLHNKDKVLTFTQDYKFSEIVDLCDKFGLIATAEDLPVKASKLEVIVGGKYNYGRQMNGEQFNGQKFVNKIFKRCEEESKWFKPACVVKQTGDAGKGQK